MAVFTVKLADVNFKIKSLYDSTSVFCKDFLTDEVEKYYVEITEEDIVFEANKSEQDYIRRNEKPIIFPNEYLETLAVLRKIINNLIDENTILFHGSAIAIEDMAYLFTAVSGTGKSTHTRLWRENLENTIMINDDKPFIKITDDKITIYGTPWMGKHNLGANVKFPLKAICYINRGEENIIKKVNKEEIYSVLFQQTQKPTDKIYMIKLLELVEKLADNCEKYILHCNISADAVKVSYNGMKG